MVKQFKQALLSALALCMGVGLVNPLKPVYAETSLNKEAVLLSSEKDSDDSVTSYEEFIDCLRELEVYAEEYANSHAGEVKSELVINYVRTGVERYRDGSWAILAGEQNDEFVQFVTVQDAENGTDTADIRKLKNFKLPNGDTVDFGHMFGTMNVTSYMAVQNPTAALIYADLGGWAGDLSDLMEGTVDLMTYSDDLEAMVAEMSTKYLGVEKGGDSDYGFGTIDIYGDLDAYYIMQSYTESKTLTTVFENYFNKHLDDVQRARFFVYTRFGEVTSREAMRAAVYNAYANNTMIIETLEPSKGLNDKTDARVAPLRYAACYALADYLWNLTGVVTDFADNTYYSVFDSEKSTLAPGVTQEKKLATTADDKQIVYYLATADVTRDDLTVFANYKDNDGSTWGMSRVMDQMNAAIKNHTDPNSPKYIENYNPVVGVNGDFYDMVTGKVSGALVMEGTTYNTASGRSFFAILKDGTPVLAEGSEWNKYADQVQEAIGGAQWLIKDSKNVAYAGADYANDRASRTAIGITADNKVVVMVLDGRQGTYSSGGALVEVAQIMLDAGCVIALNLDGGGSTTYIAKEEGSDSLAVVNSPSDGFERSVSSSLMIVSTAKSSDEFSHAIVTADSDYLTVGTSVDLEAIGVSYSGGAAELPEGTKLQLSNTSVGTLTDGVFKATNTGKTDVQVVVNDVVVGKKTLNVVVPTSIVYEQQSLNAVYGEDVELPIKATYNGNKVKINPNDVVLALDKPDAGTLKGFTFTGKESSGIRSVIVSAILASDLEANTDPEGKVKYQAHIAIDLYKKGEASFDFDNATFGDRRFAYVRDLSNTTTKDGKEYFVVDLNKDVVGSYTFGLDMKEIPIPEILSELVTMLPGGDVEGVRAWDFLLQLAERINPLTEVKITFNVDPNFDIDYSELTVVNEVFRLTHKEYDEKTNTLTIKFNWIDQEASLDPAKVNSTCILSGIKFTPKDGTEDVVVPTFTGSVEYDIYLRANAVYSMFQDEEKQKEFNIYPYIDPNNENDKGGHFTNEFAKFSDSFTVHKSGKEGWYSESDGNLYYYVDNTPVTGIQKLPTYLSEGKESYYEFDSKGACLNSKGITGKFEYQGKLYYTIAGEAKPGWRTIQEGDKTNYYYFDQTGAAVDGKQTIGGYNYTFTNYVLTKGQVVKDSTGSRYIWAGEFSTQEWITVDGKRAYTAQNGYFYTGLRQTYNVDGKWVWIMFDEEGFVVDHSGVYTYKDNIYLLDNGFVVEYPGLVLIDGYYYYFTSSNVAVKGKAYYVTKNNDLLPKKQYTFDEYGRMVIDGKPNPKPDDNPKGDIERVYGADRYATSQNVANTLKENFNVDKFSTVIITTGDNFADALAGSALAAKYNAPILSTVDWCLNDTVKYVKNNVKEGGKVYILGGKNAVPTTLEDKLAGYDIERLQGEDRYETNLAILKEAGINSREILVCTGTGYADALSASATGLPILLVAPEGLTKAQKDFLANSNADTFQIIGGVNAVSAAVETALKAYGTTNRIGGETRYETSVMIAKEFFEKPSTAIVAYAENFPDALSGGPLAMSLDAPLVLSNTGQEAAASKYMKDNSITEGIVLGGSGLISDAAAIKIFNVNSNTTITTK